MSWKRPEYNLCSTRQTTLFLVPAGWCSDAGRYLCDPAIFKQTWIPLTYKYDLALLKSTGSRFDSFCIAVCGTSRIESRVNGPACETAVDQLHRNKGSVYTSKCNRQEGTCQGPGLQLPALTLEEERLPPMAKPCKAVSTAVSTDASDRKSRKKEREL